MQREAGQSSVSTGRRLLSALLTHLPGAWIQPSNRELKSLYRVHYERALAEQRYDSAMIFLNKMLEADPHDLEARLLVGELYHRHLHDYDRAVEQYNKVLRLTSGVRSSPIHTRARVSLSELIELLS
ncbi:MAG: tetratricopeptide repeat protein [Thermoanaerobaculia bacterium]